MHFTKSVGNFIELQCIAKFISMGYDCSIPYGDAAKYDFIVDLKDKGFKRIQCKSSVRAIKSDGSLDDAIHMNLRNSQGTYTEKDIDYFATYYNNQVYIIPINETSSTTKTLRFSPPLKNIVYNKAEDYEIEKFFSIEEELEKTQDEYYNSKQQRDEELYCNNCGKQITRFSKSGLCEECSHKEKRIVIRPEREELKNMIRTLPFLKIGEKFNVSDNTVRKWCNAEKLPRTKKEINSYSDKEWEKI